MTRPIGYIRPNTIMKKFVGHVIKEISRANYKKRNPVMARMADTFRRKPGMRGVGAAIENYGVFIRIILENQGYISYAAPNALDRRVKFIAPTPKFPRPSQIKEIRGLILMVHISVNARQSKKNRRTKAKRARAR